MKKIVCVFVFICALVFAAEHLCGKELKVINLVSQFNLARTSRITIAKAILVDVLENTAPINYIDIEEEDIFGLLKTLKEVYFEKDAEYIPSGDYDMIFYTGEKILRMRLVDKNKLRINNGFCHLGVDFEAIMQKYLPEYYADKSIK